MPSIRRSGFGYLHHVNNPNAPQIVTAAPTMFKGVSSSPKNHAEMVMVETSLAMPAMDMGTTPARCMILQHFSGRNTSEMQRGHLRHFAEYHAEREHAGHGEEKACLQGRAD